LTPLTCTLIICTKDREPVLRRTLTTLFTQSRLPDHVVLVDDGAMDGPALCALLQAHKLPCAWVRKQAPGLAASRNLGIRYAPGEIVLFLDDDVLLDVHYIAELMRLFEQDPDRRLGGATGTLRQSYQPGVRLFLRTFLLDGVRPGALLPSGAGVLVREGEIHTPMQVEWLSGCNMAYRREVFDRLRFDQGLGAYGWGEDKDFSCRVGRHWQLMATPHARLTHLKEPSGRIDERRMGFMETNYHYRFFAKNMPKGPRNLAAFVWSIKGIVLRNLLMLGSARQRHAAWQRLKGNVRGLRDVLTGKEYTA
jgi:GT2 family glycosyltransferase